MKLTGVLMAVILLLVACSSPGGGLELQTLALRPANSPDVVVIGFAGRCGALCGAPYTNKADLDGKDEALQSVMSAFEAQGLSVQGYSYGAIVSGELSRVGAQGYYEAQRRLERVHSQWMDGFSNPTRVVLLAHSHGTLWSSLLAMENPGVTFDYGIYLDGVCNQWERDNLRRGWWRRNIIADFYAGVDEPYPATLATLGGACNVLEVPGSGKRHLKDVVPTNVKVALEVRSAVPAIPLPDLRDPDSQGPDSQGFDACEDVGTWVNVTDRNDNVRPDGSRDKLYTYRSPRQNHCDIPEREGKAMQYVSTFIAQQESER